jgi:putative ABC transport system permease protein
MEIRPILATLRRHPTTVLLIVMEIALACAVLSNAIAIVHDRVSRTRTPSGMVEEGLTTVEVGTDSASGDITSLARANLEALRNIPGVKSVSAVNQLPLANNEWAMSLGLKPGQKEPSAEVSEYVGTEGFMQTLGLHILKGRTFNADEYGDIESYVPRTSVIMVSQALASRLFGADDPLGRTVYLADRPFTVIGVLDHLLRASVTSAESEENTVVLPGKVGPYLGSLFVLRGASADLASIGRVIPDVLGKVDPNQVLLQRRDYRTIRDTFFQRDKSMATILVVVSASLLLVTALGIVGLTGFWVQKRRRSIGIRRALGATRLDILRYFHVENLLLAGMGGLVGMAGAFAINIMLMQSHEMARLPWQYTTSGLIVVLALGQFAVFLPALRAAAVPPVVATRGS